MTERLVVLQSGTLGFLDGDLFWPVVNHEGELVRADQSFELDPDIIQGASPIDLLEALRRTPEDYTPNGLDDNSPE